MFVRPLFRNAYIPEVTLRYVFMKSWIKKHCSMSWNMEGIQKNLRPYQKRLQKVLKKDISWMPRQNTTVLACRDEIEQFAMLMNQGLPIDTLIHLIFKKDEEIIMCLKEGKSLQEIFTSNQKKLYFKYLRILSEKLNVSDAIACVNQIEKSSNSFFETLLKKISYPFFLLIFAFFMILFFSDFVLVQMKDYISNGIVFVCIHLLKWGFGFTILSIIFYLFLYYVFFYKYNSKMKCPFRIMKKMISLQFVCM